ncbi:MAG TPA: urease accessory protein UreD [Casimicrobiaceae bacterium]|nr:urease accessory protein UreD [Casimicrobiaceae bacterium]
MGATDPAWSFALPDAIGGEPCFALPELAAYRDQPRQMPGGTVGKSGLLRIRLERRGDRTILTALESRVPYLAQRALHCDEALPDMAWVFVITTTGCVLQGDRLALEIALGAGAKGHITTQSATKVHAMDANYAVQTQVFTLDEGAYLEFLPDPLIPHRQARLASDTRITIAPTASLLYSEIVQPGRKHHRPDECFGATMLSLATRAERPGGPTLFTEKLLIEPARYPMRRSGVMDSFDVFGNVILCTPPEKADRIHERVDARVDLEHGVAFGPCRLPNGAGLVYKVLGRETAQVKAKVREFWEVVRKEITGAAIPPPFLWR